MRVTTYRKEECFCIGGTEAVGNGSQCANTHILYITRKYVRALQWEKKTIKILMKNSNRIVHIYLFLPFLENLIAIIYFMII
jgi:hypothetical protein